jgi:hypothetical protein
MRYMKHHVASYLYPRSWLPRSTWTLPLPKFGRISLRIPAYASFHSVAGKLSGTPLSNVSPFFAGEIGRVVISRIRTQLSWNGRLIRIYLKTWNTHPEQTRCQVDTRSSARRRCSWSAHACDFTESSASLSHEQGLEPGLVMQIHYCTRRAFKKKKNTNRGVKMRIRCENAKKKICIS